MSEKKFYFAVDDQTYLRAQKIDGNIIMEPDPDYDKNKYGYNYREVSNRFVDNPQLALFNVILPNHQESNDIEKRNYILKNLSYDKENKCFVFYEYLTKGTEKWPKACQWKEFEAGNYCFLVTRHEVQILTSEIADINLNDMLTAK